MAIKKFNKFGWKKDKYDSRDYKFNHESYLSFLPIQLPESVDLTTKLGPVFNQGEIGSCVANSISSAIDLNHNLQKKSFITPSRLFIYYNARLAINTVKEDSGAYIRDGIKSVAKQGVCKESTLPYDVTKFTKNPSIKAYKEALKVTALKYEAIDNSNLIALKTALASGFPIVFGFEVYTSFESEYVSKTGIVSMPKPKEETLGGHAVLISGYKKINNKEYFIVRNSWGIEWGDKGNFYMPIEYITNKKLCDDFWVITELQIK